MVMYIVYYADCVLVKGPGLGGPDAMGLWARPRAELGRRVDTKNISRGGNDCNRRILDVPLTLASKLGRKAGPSWKDRLESWTKAAAVAARTARTGKGLQGCRL